MKTQTQIETELKKYLILDNAEALAKSGLYQGMRPMSEYALYTDKGFKAALEWVLDLKEEE